MDLLFIIEGGIIGGVIAAIVIVCFFILIIIGCVMKNKDKARTVPKDAENGDPKNQDSTNEINGETLKQDTDDAPYTSKQESTNANAVTKETIIPGENSQQKISPKPRSSARSSISNVKSRTPNGTPRKT
ncbi:hypothetical protein DPMN_116206 [Dreissena polymorpha]|uniref:Uncharacterized protein n=1 Tax=Dreissena polymorpha TaxID=45954 RepID=A0A9D4QU36_DREPO|nr:hypothetical protein DPMN_116206 [Dreissena polymorpha]